MMLTGEIVVGPTILFPNDIPFSADSPRFIRQMNTSSAMMMRIKMAMITPYAMWAFSQEQPPKGMLFTVNING